MSRGTALGQALASNSRNQRAGEVSTGAGISHGDALESGRSCESPDLVRRLGVRGRKEPFSGGLPFPICAEVELADTTSTTTNLYIPANLLTAWQIHLIQLRIGLTRRGESRTSLVCAARHTKTHTVQVIYFIGSPRHCSEHISFTRKPMCSLLLLRDHHMHGDCSGGLLIHLISEGGQIQTSK
jgi:hypothetical protein